MTDERLLLEDAAFQGETRSEPELVMVSIAISLKRIADAMTETNEYGEAPPAAFGGNLRRAMQGIESVVHGALGGRR